jgi:hypothetical protein
MVLSKYITFGLEVVGVIDLVVQIRMKLAFQHVLFR